MLAKVEKMGFREVQAKGLERAARVERCHYIKPSGERCGSPAMRGLDLCYYHDRYQPKPNYRNIPCLEDPHSVQCAIQEIIEEMLNGLLDYKKAALALYGLQTAAANLKQMRLAEEKREEQMKTARTQTTQGDLDSHAEPQELDCPKAENQNVDSDAAAEYEMASCVHSSSSTTLIESPRTPQHVRFGLTGAEREQMKRQFPDMKKIRAEWLATLTREERARLEQAPAEGPSASLSAGGRPADETCRLGV